MKITLQREGIPCVTVRRIREDALVIREGSERRIVHVDPGIIPWWMTLYGEGDASAALATLEQFEHQDPRAIAGYGVDQGAGISYFLNPVNVEPDDKDEMTGMANVAVVDKPLGPIGKNYPKKNRERDEGLHQEQEVIDFDLIEVGDTVDMKFVDGWGAGTVVQKSAGSLDMVGAKGRETVMRSDVSDVVRTGQSPAYTRKPYTPSRNTQVFIRSPFA